jgi:hypothetical protein
MSFKEKVQKELEGFKSWAQEANMQAHLAKSEVSAELRTAWMEAEQHVAKLEAKLGDLSEDADDAVSKLVSALKEKREQVSKALKD